MINDTKQYSRLVFWLKCILGLSASLLLLIILIFSYSKRVDPSIKVLTKDVRIGLKYQARETHIVGNISDGSTFDFHAKALNPSHQNDKTVILSKPLGKITFSTDQKFNFSSDFASLNLDKKNILFNGNLLLENSWGTLVRTEELIVDFERKVLIGPKAILVETTYGSLESGRMEYLFSSEFDEKILFSDGVKFEIFVD